MNCRNAISLLSLGAVFAGTTVAPNAVIARPIPRPMFGTTSRRAAEKPIPKGERPVKPYLVKRGKTKNNVTLHLDRTPIKAVLSILFRRGGQSDVLGPNVTGTVTASLKNVPFDEALKQVLKANSVPLTEKQVKGVYVITGPRITRNRRNTRRRNTYQRRRTTTRRPAPAPRTPPVQRAYPARPIYRAVPVQRPYPERPVVIR